MDRHISISVGDDIVNINVVADGASRHGGLIDSPSVVREDG